MNKAITVNVFQSIMLYFLCLLYTQAKPGLWHKGLSIICITWIYNKTHCLSNLLSHTFVFHTADLAWNRGATPGCGLNWGSYLFVSYVRHGCQSVSHKLKQQRENDKKEKKNKIKICLCRGKSCYVMISVVK